jgi:tetratricopeptide (TPR) repeat protein
MVRTLLALVLVAAVGFVCYANTLHVPFVFDDDMYVTNNALIRDVRYLVAQPGAVLRSLGRDVLATIETRSTGYLTFALNYRLHGLRVEGYHVLNTVVHVLNACLVFLLVRLLARSPTLAASELSELSRAAALGAALLFVAHPVQTQAVTYVTQRFTSLAALFFLAAVVGYAGARVAAGRRARVGLYALSLVAAFLAMKTKENAFVLPVAVGLTEALFFEGPLRRRAFLVAPFVLTMAVIPLGLMEAGASFSEVLSDATKTQEDISRWTYLLTQSRVIVTYLRLLALPVNQVLDYHYPLHDGLADPAVLLSVALLAALLGTALLLVRASREGRAEYRLMAFGVIWFFVTLAVESSVIALADVIFEHRLYLPSVGLFVATVGGASLAWRRLGRRPAAYAAVFLAALVLLAHERNEVWGSKVSLWQDVVRKAPRKARGYNNLGRAHWAEGNIYLAIENYRKALRLRPDYPLARNNLGVAYGQAGFKDQAIAEYRESIRLNPEVAEPHFNLGVLLLETGRTEEARRELEAVLRLNPLHPQAGMFLRYLREERQVPDAGRAGGVR